MKNNSIKSDFTTGSVPRALIGFSIPFLITELIQSFYNVADIMVLNKFCGTRGIAGASIGGNVTQTLTFMIIGLCSGGAIMIAQYAGAKKEKDIRETISTTLWIMFILSVICTAAMLFNVDRILEALNTPQEAYEETKTYLKICMSGAVFIFGYNALNSILNGLGDSRTPMYFGAMSCVLNIVLDIIFVGVFHADVAGAAFATVISQAAALVSCSIYIMRNDFPFDLSVESLKIHPQKAAMIFKLGIPGAIQSAIVSGGFLIVSAVTNSFGAAAAAGVSAAAKINNFAQMPASAIGSAMSSIVGQNIGAKKFSRAQNVLKTSILISLVIGAAAFLIVELFPEGLLKLLVSEDEVIKAAVPYLRITAADYILVAMVFPLNGLCNGSGHTLFTMLPSIFSSVIARVPVAYLCAKSLGMGISGVALSTPTGTISAIIICGIYYLSGRWRTDVVQKNKTAK